jgi:hypothetical protein
MLNRYSHKPPQVSLTTLEEETEIVETLVVVKSVNSKSETDMFH